MRTAGFPNFTHLRDQQVRDAFRDLTIVMRPVMENEMMIGRFVEIDLVNGTTEPIAHGLGRPPLGWIQTDLRVKKGDPLVTYACAGWDRQTIQFIGNGNAKLKIWVF